MVPFDCGAWRTAPKCVFQCGFDIFYVTMSRDKDTVVAIGDMHGAQKLIMLQVVRT